jgi:hypothetical protein
VSREGVQHAVDLYTEGVRSMVNQVQTRVWMGLWPLVG